MLFRLKLFITALNSAEGNVFTGICQSFYSPEGGGWLCLVPCAFGWGGMLGGGYVQGMVCLDGGMSREWVGPGRWVIQILIITRMHSSRMPTTCYSSCLLGGEVSASVHARTAPPPAWTPPGLDAPQTPNPQKWAWTPPLGVGLDTPWAWTPPQVWVWTPSPPRCGLGHPPSQTTQPPPWVWA